MNRVKEILLYALIAFAFGLFRVGLILLAGDMEEKIDGSEVLNFVARKFVILSDIFPRFLFVMALLLSGWSCLPFSCSLFLSL